MERFMSSEQNTAVLSWEMLINFSDSAIRLAEIETELARCHESRVKHARQLKAAVKRSDQQEAASHYFAWLKAWYKIDKLRADLSAAALKEAGRFPSDGDEATSPGSGRQLDPRDLVSGGSPASEHKPDVPS